MSYLRTLFVVCTVSCDVSRDPGVIVSVRGFSLVVCYNWKPWKRLSRPKRLRERLRAPDRERIWQRQYPRYVGRTLRVPRTYATLQGVDEPSTVASPTHVRGWLHAVVETQPLRRPMTSAKPHPQLCVAHPASPHTASPLVSLGNHPPHVVENMPLEWGGGD